jgi:MFS family permease
MRFILLLGIVSLFADMTYEGAHGITGPFLSLLGATAAAAGITAGMGELIGYGIRLVSGYLADRTGRYWSITLIGYTINLVAVPLLALAGRWQVAAFLIVAERLGKAIRTPARDAMLSHATREIGRGWGFGLHEAMDQVGAILGPIIVSVILRLRGGYHVAFGILLIPALVALLVLILARMQYPSPEKLERDTEAGETPDATNTRFLPRVFWLYLSFVAVSVAGYVHFQLISYHFKTLSVVSDVLIPVLFALAMGVDALVALLIGRLYDSIGLLSLMAVPLLALPISALTFSRGYHAVVVGVLLWGAVMGIQETIMRAAIADMISPGRRGVAYGIFNTVYGLSWFLGSTIMGLLYGVSIAQVILFSIALQVVSVPLLFAVRRELSAT